jgi:hypothetical protein
MPEVPLAVQDLDRLRIRVREAAAARPVPGADTRVDLWKRSRRSIMRACGADRTLRLLSLAREPGLDFGTWAFGSLANFD